VEAQRDLYLAHRHRVTAYVVSSMGQECDLYVA
jgi:hypothetical protein